MTDEHDTTGTGDAPAAPGAGLRPDTAFQEGESGTPAGAELGEATIVEPPPPPVYEAAVSPVGPQPRLSARVRWGVALGVVALVVGLSTAAFALLSGGGSLSTLAGWMPADTYAYGEVRLDLPGDQHQAVADLLSRFPGFADESSLDQKVTEVLDRLIADASSGKDSYSDIKPWLGDSAAFAAHGTLDPATKTGQGLVAVSITNAAAARDWIAKHDTDTANETTETYNGAQVTLRTAPNGEKAAFAVLNTVILAGDEASVKAAIDSKGAGGFATTANVKSAVAMIDGTPLGFLYVDLHKLMDLALAASPSTGAMLNQSVIDQLPAWIGMTARAQSDGFQVDVFEPAVAGSTQATARTSTLAARLPASTVAAIEVHDLGSRVRQMLDKLGQQDATKGIASQIQQALTSIGGIDSLLGWAGDADIVVTAHDGALDGGLVVATTDEKGASTVTGMLRSLIALAGSSSGATVKDEAYGAGTISVVDLGDLANLSQLTGQSLSIPPGTRAGFAFTVQNGLFILGSTDTFVKSVIDASGGSSLAGQDRYKQAIGRAGASNTGQTYLDIAGIATAVESMLPPEVRAKYESDVKPYVTPFGAFAFATSGGDPLRMRAVVTIH